jgi:hypothetical protein
VDIIDLGMGNPDMPTPEHIVEKLQETVKDPRTHRYSSSKGIPGLRKAQASYYGRRFGVKVNPDTQVVATLGSKEGFANMAAAITAPGDVVLVPNPTYPIHSFGFIMAGGVVRSMPAEPNEDFMRSLDRAVRHSIPKPIALVLNYPANPTAYTATLDFYKEVVAYCKAQNIFILSDLAYAEIYFDGEVPPSILEVPGAIDCPRQILPRLRRLHADSGCRCVGAQWDGLDHRGSAQHLPDAPRRDGRELHSRWLGHSFAQGDDVRLDSHPRRIRASGLAGVCQAADPGDRRGGRAGGRVR